MLTICCFVDPKFTFLPAGVEDDERRREQQKKKDIEECFGFGVDDES